MKFFVFLFLALSLINTTQARDNILLQGVTTNLDYLKQPEGRNTARESIVIVRDNDTLDRMSLTFKFRYYERKCDRYFTDEDGNKCREYRWIEKLHRYRLKIDFSMAHRLQTGERESFAVFLRQSSWNRKQVHVSVTGISTMGEYQFNFADGWMRKPILKFVKY